MSHGVLPACPRESAYFNFYKVSFNHGVHERHCQLALPWDAKRGSSSTVREGSALDESPPLRSGYCPDSCNVFLGQRASSHRVGMGERTW